MANAILTTLGTRTAFTITMASLGSSTAGVGRQTAIVDNTTTKAFAALIHWRFAVGTTPTINKNIYLYLIRYDNSAIGTDGSGTGDAAWTRVNAPRIDALTNNSATSNLTYENTFDTAHLGALGPKWAIGIVHDTGVNANATEGNHLYAYTPYWMDVQ